MGKKKNKKLAEILGDAQVVLFNRYQLDSTIQPNNGPGNQYVSRLTLDLMGKNVLGNDLNAIHVHFLPDGDAIPPPQTFGNYVICHQPMKAFAAMKYMLDAGVDIGFGNAFFYGTFTSVPASVEFSLLSGELSQKQMLSMLKKDLEMKHQDQSDEHIQTLEMHHQE